MVPLDAFLRVARSWGAVVLACTGCSQAAPLDSSTPGDAADGETRQHWDGSCEPQGERCTGLLGKNLPTNPGPPATDESPFSLDSRDHSGSRARLNNGVFWDLFRANANVAFDVIEDSYAVAGETADAIRTHLDTQGPEDPNDRKRVDALTWTEFVWSWKKDCSLDVVRARTKVTLPRYVGADPNLRITFGAYLKALRSHEFRHVALAEEYAIRLALQIQQDIAPLSAAASRHGNCNTMNSLVQRRFDETLVQFVQANVHLDEQSRHGTLDGACWLCR